MDQVYGLRIIDNTRTWRPMGREIATGRNYVTLAPGAGWENQRMRRRFCVALVGASLIGLVTADHAASAQSVPMPRPAPHTRTRTPPPPTAEKPKPNEAP